VIERILGVSLRVQAVEASVADAAGEVTAFYVQPADPPGRRGTKAGAQAVLDLRAVRLNAHWDRYGQFHRQQQHHRLYGSSAPVPEGVESQALQLAT
jgi:hypothetical protein